MSKILVYMANGLGNCVLAIPALKSLQLLGHSVDLAIPKEWARSKPLVELFANQAFIHEIVQERAQISSVQYERIFIPNTYERTELRAFLEGFECSVVIKHPNWRDTLTHESEFLMAMPRSLGYRGPAPDIQISTIPPQSLPNKPFLTLAFSCLEGYPWSLKRWPLEHWKGLLLILLSRLPDYEFVFIGSKGDTNDANTLISAVNSDRVKNCCGIYSVSQSAHVLSKSQCLITVDNGISHLAAASGLDKIVALYGPTLLSKNIPMGREIHVVRAGINCSPCFDTKLFRKCTKNECMQTLTSEVVADYLMSIIANKGKCIHGCLSNMQ